MNAKLKILCDGWGTYVELDGKTIGRGIESIKFEHDAAAGEKPKCQISIDLSDFEFMPDGRFDEVAKRSAEMGEFQEPWIDPATVERIIERYRNSTD